MRTLGLDGIEVVAALAGKPEEHDLALGRGRRGEGAESEEVPIVFGEVGQMAQLDRRLRHSRMQLRFNRESDYLVAV